MMRTTFEVMQAVQEGAPATEEELRYALAMWSAGFRSTCSTLRGALRRTQSPTRLRRGLAPRL